MRRLILLSVVLLLGISGNLSAWPDRNSQVQGQLYGPAEKLYIEYGKPTQVMTYLSGVTLHVWKGKWPAGRIVFVDIFSQRAISVYPTDIDTVAVKGKVIEISYGNVTKRFESLDDEPVFEEKGPISDPCLFIGAKPFIAR